MARTASDARLFRKNACALRLSNFNCLKDRVVPPTLMLCAVDRVKLTQLQGLLSIESLMHRCIHASVHAAVEIVTQVLLEVEVSKVARWAVSTRTWRSEARVTTPLVSFTSVANVLGERRMEVSANLGS